MIQLDNVAFSYDTNMQFDLYIPAEQFVTISGVSGSGKSTLLNLIAGFIHPKPSNPSGRIILNEIDCTQALPHQRSVSMLFQENNVFNHLTVAQNIGLGLQPYLKFTQQQQQQIQQVARQVNLIDYLSRTPNQLSGGQKQRVAIARCFIREYPILLLDEPFSSLDKALRLEMADLLLTVCKQKRLTVMMVTHQPEEVMHLSDRHLEVESGAIVNDYLVE